MAQRMALGNDSIPASPLLSDKNAGRDLQNNQLQKALNEKSVKYQEKLYWLKLELDTTRKEKQAVEDRMTKLYRDMQELKEGGGDQTSNENGSRDEIESLALKHERTVQTLQSQIALLRASSEQVVRSLKDEVRDLVGEKARTEMELMNQLADMEKEKYELTQRLGEDDHSLKPGENAELKLEIQQLRQEKAALADQLRKERAASRETISALRHDKTSLTEQVEKMQGDLVVLRASVDTVHSIDQMKQDRDESMKALDRVAQLWERADQSLKNIESLVEVLQEDDDEDEGNDRARLLDTMESASLLHGQVKVSLMLIELKLRNTLACLKNDASQLAVAFTDPNIAKQIKNAEAEALAEIRKVQDQVHTQMEKLETKSAQESTEVRNVMESKLKEMKELQERQAQLEKDIHKMSVEELGDMAREHSSSENQQVELFVSRKILERLQNEVVQVVKRVQDKNETIGRLKATIDELTARERTLIDELKRLMNARSTQTLQDREKLPLMKLLQEMGADITTTTTSMTASTASDDFVEEEILEEEIIEEEIIDDPRSLVTPISGSKMQSVPMIEEEEEEILED
ncbi:hypothetical protein ACA910_018979 [Epithemia clementina (nom. ined.)]